jgi:cell division protein FtsW (lipid II flippase)
MLNKEEYLDSVCKEIKFKAARKVLRRELAAHIDDKRQELASAGTPDAESEAVAMMGEAKEAGRALNAIHRPRIEWRVFLCVLLLSLAGTMIIRNFNSDDIYFVSGAWSYGVQLFAMFLGICIAFSLYFLDYTRIVKLRFVFYFSSIGLLLLYILLGDRMSLFLTQSNIVTSSTILFLLGIFGFIGNRKRQNIAGLLLILVPCIGAMLTMGMVAASLYSLLIGLVSFSALFISIFRSSDKLHIRLIHLLAVACILSAAQMLVMKISPYYVYRIIGLIGFGTQIGQYGNNPAIISQITGGAKLLGVSDYYIANQSSNISESGTTFILASVLARYGWLTALGLMLAFMALFIFMASRVRKIEYPLGKLIAIGITIFFLTRFVLNVLTSLGIMEGVSFGLPFVSYGYAGYITDWLLIGIFLSVWRRSTFMKNDNIITPATAA